MTTRRRWAGRVVVSSGAGGGLRHGGRGHRRASPTRPAAEAKVWRARATRAGIEPLDREIGGSPPRARRGGGALGRQGGRLAREDRKSKARLGQPASAEARRPPWRTRPTAISSVCRVLRESRESPGRPEVGRRRLAANAASSWSPSPGVRGADIGRVLSAGSCRARKISRSWLYRGVASIRLARSALPRLPRRGLKTPLQAPEIKPVHSKEYVPYTGRGGRGTAPTTATRARYFWLAQTAPP